MLEIPKFISHSFLISLKVSFWSITLTNVNSCEAKAGIPCFGWKTSTSSNGWAPTRSGPLTIRTLRKSTRWQTSTALWSLTNVLVVTLSKSILGTKLITTCSLFGQLFFEPKSNKVNTKMIFWLLLLNLPAHHLINILFKSSPNVGLTIAIVG